jgi:hypothetical protein
MQLDHLIEGINLLFQIESHIINGVGAGADG